MRIYPPIGREPCLDCPSLDIIDHSVYMAIVHSLFYLASYSTEQPCVLVKHVRVDVYPCPDIAYAVPRCPHNPGTSLSSRRVRVQSHEHQIIHPPEYLIGSSDPTVSIYNDGLIFLILYHIEEVLRKDYNWNFDRSPEMSRRSNKKAQIKAKKIEDEKKNSPPYPIAMLKKHLKVVAVVIVVIVIIAVFALNIVHLPFSNGGYQLPANIPFSEFGTYYKVNSTDYAPSNSIDIYFVTWVGCPYGAGNSWELYNFLNGFSSIQSSVSGHFSDPNEGRLASVPGLLFTSSPITVKGVNGISISLNTYYMYNEYMNNGYNAPYVNITSSNAISVALSELQADNLPVPIYNIVKSFTTVVDATNYAKPSAYLGNPAHINTITIFTGPKGTYLVNGGMIDPVPLEQYTYSTLLSTPDVCAEVSSGTTLVANIVNSIS